MRVIKFRAIIAGTNEFIYGLPYTVYSDNKIDSIHNDTGEIEYIKLDTLSQFTGLKDKSGVEIYEGDKVKYKGLVYEILFQATGSIGWCRLGNDGGYYSLHSSETKRYEVIGNIHN